MVNDICNKDVCSRKKWCQVQISSNHFWKRWLCEYLPPLTLRSKWTAQKEQINISDLVLINEDNVKRGQWPLGRVVEVHLAEDGVVRVVTVRTSKGIFQRPAVKIFRLENDGKFEVPQDGENVKQNIETCVLHNQTLDEHDKTQCGITRHLKLCKWLLSIQFCDITYL